MSAEAMARRQRSQLLWSLAAMLAGWSAVYALRLNIILAVAVMAGPSLALLWFSFRTARDIYGTGFATGMLVVTLLLHRWGYWWAEPALAVLLAWRLTEGLRRERVGPAL
jgi:hypothetical protein